MCQSSTYGRVLVQAWVQVLQNSASRMVVLRFATLSARGCHRRNPREKNYREHSNIKARVSVNWLGRAQCDAKWQGRDRAFQHSWGIEPRLPDSVYDSSYFATCNRFFLRAGVLFSDCSNWISRPDTIHQNSWTQTFEQYISCTQHRLELKFFHFAHFLHNAHQAARRPWKSENW